MPTSVGRFAALDAARAFAAVVVLIKHYRHFFFQTGATTPPENLVDVLPLYQWLWPFYDHGEWAVPVFWGISGFVLAHGYAGTKTSARAFFVARLARLYPLHLLTLLAVALLQWLAIRQYGTTLVFGNHDWSHFIAQIFLASDWGIVEGLSFNAPIWSVSAEIAVYVLFWLVSPWLLRRGIVWPVLLTLVLLPYAAQSGASPILRCAFFFFVGTACYCLFPRRGLSIKRGGDIAEHIGNCTYGMYLWHVPLQLAVMLAVTPTVAREYASSPALLVAYLLAVITVSTASYKYIETPARRLLIRASRDSARPRRLHLEFQLHPYRQ